MVWYPTAKYIIQLHALLMQQYTDKERNYGVDQNRLEGILDRLEHGLPMEDQEFWEKTSYFFYDMINLHCFEDGNKRISQVILEIFLENNGFMLNASRTEKENFILDIASSIIEEREAVINKIQDWFNIHRI